MALVLPGPPVSYTTSWDSTDGGEDNTESEVSPALTLILGRVTEKLTSFEELSKATQRKFQRAGGQRLTFAQAKELYRRVIPWADKAQGEQAVLDRMRGQDFSHIESASNNPSIAADPQNIVLESPGRNPEPGARDYDKPDQVSAQAKNVGAATGKVAAKSAWYAALWEAPVSAVENSIGVLRGRLSKKRAATNTVKDTGRAAASGGAIAVAIVVLRIGFLAHPVVAWAGTGIFAATTAQRLINAWRESPLTPLVLYFHPDCYQHYAAELSEPEMTQRGVIIDS